MACTDIDRQDQMDVAMFRQLLGQLSAAYESLHGRVEQYREQELNSKWACKEMIASRISREAPLDVGLALRVSFAPADYAPLMKKPSVRRVSSTSYTVSAEQQRSSTGFQGTSIRASVVKKKTGDRREVCWANLVLSLMEKRRRPLMRLFWEEDALALSVHSAVFSDEEQQLEIDEDIDAVLQAWRYAESVPAPARGQKTVLRKTAAGTGTSSRSMIKHESESLSYKCSLESLVISPLSWPKSVWMGLGVHMIFIDFMLLTLGIFGLDTQTPAWKGFEVFAGVFWVCDIILTFFTGVYHHQHIVTDFRVIAHHYVTRWFFFDFSMVVLQWVIFIIEMGSGSKVKVLKYIKLAKYVRLLRLAKVEELVIKVLDQVNSVHMIAVFRMVGHLAGVLLFVHCSATAWYWSGKQMDGVSWAVDAAGNGLTDGFPLNYFMALHWAVSQFQGNCDIFPGRSAAERAVTCVFVFASVVVLAMLFSKLAALMHQMSDMKAAKEQYINTARVYLEDNKISTELSMRVRKYFQWMQINTSADKTGSDEILQILPFDLRCELLEETRMPVVASHCAFAALLCVHKRAWQRIICDALKPVPCFSGDYVFTYDKVCDTMGFVVSGGIKYFRYPAVLQTTLKFCGRAKVGRERPISMSDLLEKVRNQHAVMLAAGGSFCEAALWIDWRHCGDLVAVDKVSLLMLNIADFDEAMHFDPSTKTHFEANAKRWAEVLNLTGQDLANDVTTSEGIIAIISRRDTEYPSDLGEDDSSQ